MAFARFVTVFQNKSAKHIFKKFTFSYSIYQCACLSNAISQSIDLQFAFRDLLDWNRNVVCGRTQELYVKSQGLQLNQHIESKREDSAELCLTSF